MTCPNRNGKQQVYLPPPKIKGKNLMHDADEIISNCSKKKDLDDTIQNTEEKKRNISTKQGARQKLKNNESLLSDDGNTNSDKKD